MALLRAVWRRSRLVVAEADLQRLAAEHGVKVATTGHKYPVDPAAVRDAVTPRDSARGDITTTDGPA